MSIKPCDSIIVPIFQTYRSTNGIVCDRMMFAEAVLIILKYVEDDGKEHMIFVMRPQVFRNGVNFYNTDTREWAVK
jgi:hypothetical protein